MTRQFCAAWAWRLSPPLRPTPGLLAEYLKADDEADAGVDLDEFARGIRRAVRLRLARASNLHRRSRQTWKSWVRQHFKAGYECYHRYNVAAQIQVGLLARDLPPLENGNQCRALAPFRKHERFWGVLPKILKEGIPPAADLKSRVSTSLGLTVPRAASTPRIQLHRALRRLVERTPAGQDDIVAQALVAIARAIAILQGDYAR